MAEMEKGQSDTDSEECTPANCRRKSNKEDNPHGTTDGSGCTIEAGSAFHGAMSDDFLWFFHVKTDGIELGLKNSTVMVGDSATFRLRLHDNTEEAGEWTRDDVTLTHSEKTQISINGSDRQLTVTDVHPPDTGKYAYRVGEEMTSAHLSIKEARCFGSVLHPPPPPIIPI